MRNILLCSLLILAGACSAAETEDLPSTGLNSEFAITGDVAVASKTTRGQVVCLVARRISGIHADDTAYERVSLALKDVAKSAGLRVAEPGQACLVLEVSSTFYAYTTRFNARVLHLPEYAQAAMDAEKGKDPTKIEQHVDVGRVAAGVLGLVRGWISPAFGSYVVTSGAAPALFGSGSAPMRLFVAGKERYERGEQEVNTKVRVLEGGDVVATFGVRNWIQGDTPPFDIDGLVAANWSKVMALLLQEGPVVDAPR